MITTNEHQATEKQPPDVLYKKGVFGLNLYQDETLKQLLFSVYCKTFKNIYFDEHLRTSPSEFTIFVLFSRMLPWYSIKSLEQLDNILIKDKEDSEYCKIKDKKAFKKH